MNDIVEAALKSLLKARPKMQPNHECAYWMYNAVSREQCDRALEDAEHALERPGVPAFDTIAFTGVSGTLFGSVLAHKLGREILCVRKDRGSEYTHSQHDVEGYSHAKQYLIVDDIVSTGRTLVNIIKAVKKMNPSAQCIGVYTYNGAGDNGSINGFAGVERKLVSRCIECADEEIKEDERLRTEKYKAFLHACKAREERENETLDELARDIKYQSK